jgi:hypothetical protein
MNNKNVYDYVKGAKMDAPVVKKEPLDIHRVLIELKTNSDLKTKEDKVRFLRKYPHIEHDYNKLYDMAVNNDMNDNSNPDIRILNLMLDQSQDIKDNKIKKIDGEKKVGTLLMNTYITPHLK